MGRDLTISYPNNGALDYDSPCLDIMEDFFKESWPKWYEKQYKKDPDFIFYYELTVDRKTLKKLYEYIREDKNKIKLDRFQKEILLNQLSYILDNTGKKKKVKFEFW